MLEDRQRNGPQSSPYLLDALCLVQLCHCMMSHIREYEEKGTMLVSFL